MIFEDWGLVDYQQALEKQTDYVQTVASDENHPGYLIFCSHPAVVTTGRQTKPDDIFAWNGPVIEVSRGGRATYHGPSQVVVYPILNLKKPRAGRGPQEIRGYIRALEQAIIETLKKYDIQGQGKTLSATENSSLEDTGVWVQDRKIASLGIAVRKWISFHGAAINVTHDKTAFQGLNPCGYKSNTMISLEEILNEQIIISDFKNLLKENCLRFL
ncbi:MAG: lipoyl(octanoyl) transferase LipB [Bdellovibrio sp.]|nr:lipoyl(octanoyl) transferase LipB [Bdellovibrio sp.]